MASEEGQRRLAGFMLRRYADRVAATHRAGRSTILFHFDH
jgi:NCS2 family nucleobase:cation symporter-2